MKTELQVRELLAAQQQLKAKVEATLPTYYDQWVNPINDMKTAVHARHMYQEGMGEIAWHNAVIGTLRMVLGELG